MSVLDDCRGRWAGILTSLGVDARYLRSQEGPCPFCGGRDRFRFDDKDGRGTWWCQQCGHGDGMDLAMRHTGRSFADLAAELDQTHHKIPRQAAQNRSGSKKSLLRYVGTACKQTDARMAVRRYLKGRGLEPSPVTQDARLTYYRDGDRVPNIPAMVHLVVDADNQAATYHVTYLTEAGSKIALGPARKIMPPARPWQGGAVRLFKPGPTLGIAEGIETALACHRQDGIPVWAALNAKNLERFVPPPEVRRLVVYGDNDASYTGQAAAYALAGRLSGQLEVSVYIPEELDTDWADHGGEP